MLFNSVYKESQIHTTLTRFETLITLLQTYSVYFTMLLIITFIFSLTTAFLTQQSVFFKKLFNLFKWTIILISSSLLIITFFKFNMFLWNYEAYSIVTNSQFVRKVSYQTFMGSHILQINGSAFSDVILILALSSGLICILLLGEKNLSKYVSNINAFAFFFIAIIFMVYTTNLLIMFIAFEALFLPTLYFVYSHGYVQRVDKTLKILLYWTLTGAFLIFTALMYLYFKYKTLTFSILANMQFSTFETIILHTCIFIGFGVKIPVFPFHYWLTKIHVEAPAGFSIFLSGFLVKAALFCFFYFNLLFSNPIFTNVMFIISLLGMTEASFKMWTQTDFKKLIAFATIQEMNLILFLLLATHNIIEYGVLLFILIHGWLSTLMFFIVDVIQKKTHTRNILSLAGIGLNSSSLKQALWLIILLFSGFPLTIKYAIEWQFLGTLLTVSQHLTILIFFIISFFGTVGFTKQLFIIMYGTPTKTFEFDPHLSKRDKTLFYFIINSTVYLNHVNLFLF